MINHNYQPAGRCAAVALFALLSVQAVGLSQDGDSASEKSTPTMEAAAAKITADIRLSLIHI